MPTFIYEGKANSLRVSGRTLVRGRPTELDGIAAESAAAYAAKRSDLREVTDADATAKPAKGGSRRSGSSKGLAERQALVARAKELGIPAKGKSADLAAAIAEAEAAEGAD